MEDFTYESPAYAAWLEELKSLAEKEGVAIQDIEYRDALVGIYSYEKAPVKALLRYKDFLRRWAAIKADYEKN